jgi:hypothetical protein
MFIVRIYKQITKDDKYTGNLVNITDKNHQ